MKTTTLIVILIQLHANNGECYKIGIYIRNATLLPMIFLYVFEEHFSVTKRLVTQFKVSTFKKKNMRLNFSFFSHSDIFILCGEE